MHYRDRPHWKCYPKLHKRCDDIFIIQYMIQVYRLTFHKSRQMPFSTSTKKKEKRVYKLSCWWLKSTVGLAAFCMTAWYDGTKGTPCHDKPFPWGDFFSRLVQGSTAILSACYWADRNLAYLFSWASVLQHWHRNGFFFVLLRRWLHSFINTACWSYIMAFEAFCDFSFHSGETDQMTGFTDERQMQQNSLFSFFEIFNTRE